MARIVRIDLLYSAAVSALFWMALTVNMVYWISIAQSDPLQLDLVGTVLEASATSVWPP